MEPRVNSEEIEELHNTESIDSSLTLARERTYVVESCPLNLTSVNIDTLNQRVFTLTVIIIA